jgi:glutaredoxin-related protein
MIPKQFCDQCKQIKKQLAKIDIHKKINNIDFQESIENFQRDEMNNWQKTIVIDIEDSLITKVYGDYDPSCQEFIKVGNNVYMIKPEVFDFVRSIHPFFELIIFSNYQLSTLNTIIEHIEKVLNKPKLKSSRKCTETVYFNYILDKSRFVNFGDFSI